MRIYYDWEFIEDGRTIDGISIGMVCEDGREFYAVNEEIDDGGTGHDALYKRITQHRWLMENVVPHLPLMRDHEGKLKYDLDRGSVRRAYFHLDLGSNLVMPRRMIRNSVREFVLSTPDPELWAWYGAYDHVCLAQLFGPMVRLPGGFPMFTRDLKQEYDRLHAERYTGRPDQATAEHNALNDARWNAQLGAWLQDLERENAQ